MKQLNDILEIFANRGSGADENAKPYKRLTRSQQIAKRDREIEKATARMAAKNKAVSNINEAESAKDRFSHHEALVKQHLKDISSGLAAMKANAKQTSGIHYGHVGTIADHAERLKDIADCLHNRGEYAPENIAHYSGKYTRGMKLKD